jgi:predicted RNA binding protein YcfA (HicA-like mRNA interferase family)
VFGFQFDRQGPGGHEIWRHAAAGKKVAIPHPTSDGTLRAILRDVNAFLKA